jgi:hypothetical protein
MIEPADDTPDTDDDDRADFLAARDLTIRDRAMAFSMGLHYKNVKCASGPQRTAAPMNAADVLRDARLIRAFLSGAESETNKGTFQ